MGKQRVDSPWGTTFCDSISISGAGRWIYISGQIGAEDDGSMVGGSFAEEADHCFARVALSLEKAGATMNDVVKITGYVTSTEDYPAYDLARGRAFAGNPPSSATVQVAGLANAARLEVEAVAFVSDEG
jgi:2-iminobutanoate/2-iminopropanoate deaminase